VYIYDFASEMMSHYCDHYVNISLWLWFIL